MPMMISDPALEDRLVRLGAQQQPLPETAKNRFAIKILRAAIQGCEDSGDPHAWKTAYTTYKSKENS